MFPITKKTLLPCLTGSRQSKLQWFCSFIYSTIVQNMRGHLEKIWKRGHEKQIWRLAKENIQGQNRPSDSAVQQQEPSKLIISHYSEQSSYCWNTIVHMPTENYPMCKHPSWISQENLCILREIIPHTAGASAAIKNQLLLCTTNGAVIYRIEKIISQTTVVLPA